MININKTNHSEAKQNEETATKRYTGSYVKFIICSLNHADAVSFCLPYLQSLGLGNDNRLPSLEMSPKGASSFSLDIHPEQNLPVAL